MADQSSQLDWRGDVPVSRQFDDPYYSLENGLAETEHVFLQGNSLPQRFEDGFHIAELGFGTGLNLCVALRAFRASGAPGKLHFTSFEAFPLSEKEMHQALAAFPAISGEANDILEGWTPSGVQLHDLSFSLIVGDARVCLSDWQDKADAWFLDGFSPAKNPALWEPHLLGQVGQHTKPQGTCATYTAAGHVRRALDAAGFEITRVPGFGRKRHMSIGTKR